MQMQTPQTFCSAGLVARPDQSVSGMHGVVEVSFQRRHDENRLVHLHQVSPLRVLFPHRADGDIPQAALVTTSGGVVGGDRLDFRLSVGEDCRAQFVAQAAEKVYRSAGDDACITMDLTAAPGSWAEYLPQETILFNGARLRRLTRLHAQADARILAGEIVVFGRSAMGERVTCGLLREAWEVRQDNRLIWADALHLGNKMIDVLAAPAGFGGALAYGTLLLLCPDPSRYLEPLRTVLEAAPHVGVGVVNGLLLVRWLADDAADLRRSFAHAWAYLRHAEAGLPDRLPRLWAI